MKKTPYLVMLFGILAFILAQNCDSGGNKVVSEPSATSDTVDKPKEKVYEPKETVEIYMVSIQQIEKNGDTTHHLAMFDANGDFGVDRLATTFVAERGKSGHIKWKKVHKSGIKKLIEIKYAGDGEPIIFKKGPVYKDDNEWDLEIPENILIIIGNTVRQEKYIIKYLLENGNDTVTIDPYLRVPPEP